MAGKLSKPQRDLLYSGSCPAITGTGACGWSKGDTYRLAPTLEFRVNDIEIHGRRWELVYEVYWRPTQEQHARLLAGNFKPFSFDDKPGCEVGAIYVFAWSRAKRHADPETGQVFDAPEAPAAWIKVTRKIRKTDHYVVHFDVFDKRHVSLMMARGSGYTTDPRVAIDRVEAVLSDDDVRRHATDAKAARAAQLERSEDARRKQERGIRSRLRETLRGLSPVAQAALLAELERIIVAADDSPDETSIRAA